METGRRGREKQVGAEVGESKGDLKFSGALLPGNITHPAASSHCERATRVIPHLSPFSLKPPPPSPVSRASFTRPVRAKRQMRNEDKSRLNERAAVSRFAPDRESRVSGEIM